MAAMLCFTISSHGIVNHLPEGTVESAALSHVERKSDGLNQILGTQFTDLTEFPYWDHVGMVGMGSGIYLGDGRVLTSAHVGCYPFRSQDGSIHQPDYASWRVLRNADGSKSDLAVFDVKAAKSSSLGKLGTLPIATSHSDRPILLIGTGYTQGAQPIKLASQGLQLGVLGYQVEPLRSSAWAMNRASEEIDRPVATDGRFTTRCFTTRFEHNDFAGQAAQGDSGGAAFSYNRELNRWELSGCIIAVSQRQMSVNFGARTFLGDLGFYAPQIATATGRVAQQPVTWSGTPLAAQPAAIR